MLISLERPGVVKKNLSKKQKKTERVKQHRENFYHTDQSKVRENIEKISGNMLPVDLRQ